jgi:hypothetical protein
VLRVQIGQRLSGTEEGIAELQKWKLGRVALKHFRAAGSLSPAMAWSIANPICGLKADLVEEVSKDEKRTRHVAW